MPINLPQCALTDAEFNERLAPLLAADLYAYLVITKSDTLVCTADADGIPGDPLGRGDAGAQTQALLLKLASRGRLFWAAASDAEFVAELVNLPAGTRVDRRTLQSTFRALDAAAFGRAREVSPKTAEIVCRRAAWRCQFDGCGTDLSEHFTTGKPGNFAYLAHIVAASPAGPRGSLIDSARLADDPDNILLLCDSCHRLIDRIEPAKYTVPVLHAMRDRSITEVERLLDSLKYPEYHVLTVVGDVAGQSAVFNRTEAYDAMRTERMRPVDSPHSFLTGPMDQPNNTEAAHWHAQAHAIEADVKALQQWLNGASRSGARAERLAVFPLHNTTKLVLAGRVVGEARTVRLFQYRRNIAGGIENQWTWPAGVQPPGPDAFYSARPETVTLGTEGLLLYFLTDQPSLADLPEELRTLPTWRIAAATPSRHVINHPACLDKIAGLIEDVLADVEHYRVARLHIVAIAPATACFRMGQKLQARHHVPVVLYERSPHKDSEGRYPFKPTLNISPGTVDLGGGVTIRI